jgi:hypothetical protein
MAPSAIMRRDDDMGIPLIELACSEIEQIRRAKDRQKYHAFPNACMALLKSLEGNHRCVDCGERNPQWAAVKYGAMLCLHCCGHHRSLGVGISSVRSVCMDEWSIEEVLSMLEGGNAQLTSFFDRHHLSEHSLPEKSTTLTKENVTRLRYKTKAAKFYRKQMELHIQKVLENAPYQGRDHSRQQRYPQIARRNSSVE